MALFLVFAALLVLGTPIAYCLGAASVVVLFLDGFKVTTFANILQSGTAKFSLLAIPFFILAGVVMERAGISRRLVELAKVFVGHIFGGLAIVTVVVSCFFAAISGSGPATVAALAPILMPAMEEAGYRKDWAAALIANSGNIGIIIPPSVIFVIYGVLAEVSIGKLFIAGIIPGLIFGLALIITSLISLKRQGGIRRMPRFSARERWDGFKSAVWGILSPVIILGGIYTGVFTPTESAGVAAVYGLFVGLLIYREIKVKDLWSIFTEAAVSTAVVMFIVANASVFAWLMTTNQIAATISDALLSVTTDQIMMLFMINLVLLFAGCFLDSGSAMYIFIPILMPIIKVIGYDPLVFGVVATVNLAIGMATPPVGLDLYVACNVSGVSLKSISIQTIRFVLASLIVLMLLTYLPILSTWLPTAMGM